MAVTQATNLADFSSGVDTGGNTINVGTALTLSHTQGIQFHTQNLHATGFEVNNINASGIITASSANFNGNVSIAGTLTYEDITNIDSVGLITARNGIHVTAGTVGIGTDNPETVRGNNVLEVAGTTGGEVIASRNDTSMTDGDFIGGFVFKNRDAGGDPNHFGGMYAKANGTAGAMDLHFSSDRTRYESDNPDLTITNSNVGIGTDNPALKLHVEDSGSQIIRFARTGIGAGSLDIDGNGNAVFNSHTTNADVIFHTQTNERLRITSGGDVSISSNGTVHGVSKLTILPADRTSAFSASDGDTWHDVVLKQTGSAANNAVGIAFETSTSGYHKNAGTGIAAVKNGTNSDYGSDLVFITRGQSVAASERLRITSAGSVGIGTDSPNFSTFGSNTGGIEISDVDSNNALLVQSSSNELYFGNSSLTNFIWGASNTPFAIATNNTERLRITSGGLVGINTNDPQKTLHVNSSANNSFGIVRISGKNRGSQLEFCTDATKTAGIYSPTSSNELVFFTSSSETERLRINSAGALNIGSGSETTNAANLVEMYVGSTDGTYGTIRGKYNRTNEFNRSEVRFGVESNAGGKGFLAFATGNNTATERIRITSAGTVCIGAGTTTPRTGFFNVNSITPVLQVEQAGPTDDGRFMSLVSNSAGSSGYTPTLLFGKSRGTTVGSAGVLSDGDEIGAISFQGADGSQLVESARIVVAADGTIGADKMPGSISFQTTPPNAAAPAEKLRITSAGLVGIGTVSPNEELHIHANGTSYVRFTDELSGCGTTDGVIFGLDHPHLYAWNY